MLAWRLSNTLTTDFHLAALEEALARYGTPKIINTDQGAQYTSGDWLDRLKSTGCRISEEVYLHAYRDGREAQRPLAEYFDIYNRSRLHQSLDYQTPDEVYFGARTDEVAAAA